MYYYKHSIYLRFAESFTNYPDIRNYNVQANNFQLVLSIIYLPILLLLPDKANFCIFSRRALQLLIIKGTIWEGYIYTQSQHTCTYNTAYHAVMKVS